MAFQRDNELSQSAPRRVPLNWGRWVTQRERLRLNLPKPPPADCSDPTLRPVIERLLRQAHIEDRYWMCELEQAWPEIAGVRLAQHTRPGELRERTLIVFVDHPLWLSELKRYHLSALLQAVQQRVGAARVEKISLRSDPGRRPADSA